MADRGTSEDPVAGMRAMRVAYLAYALEHPLEYRLMFETGQRGMRVGMRGLVLTEGPAAGALGRAVLKTSVA